MPQPGRLVLWVLLAAGCLLGCGDQPPLRVVTLDDATIDTYLEVYRVVGPIYRDAYASGASPGTIPRQKEIRAALEKAGWTWEQYQSVHGSVSNALLKLEKPEEFHRLKMGRGAVPAGNLELVERRYFELKQARLIVEQETYRTAP